MKAHLGATRAPLLEEADAAISARVADQQNKALGRMPLAEEEKSHGATSKVTEAVAAGAPSKSIMDSRWVCTWTMVEGDKDVKDRSVAEWYQALPLSSLKKWAIWSLGIKNVAL